MIRVPVSMETLVPIILQYKYLILVPLAIFEGPLISLVVGFMVFMGYLEFVPSYIVLLFGDFIPDIAYYYIGRFGEHKKIFQKYIIRGGSLTKNLELVQRLWQHHPHKTMFFSKLAYGLSTPFLISAGYVKMPIKKFIASAFPVTVVQYGIILLIGYYLGHSYTQAEKYIQYTGVFVAAVIIVLIVGYILFSKYMKKKLELLEVEEGAER